MRELWSHLRLGDWSSVVPHTFLLLPREVDGLVGIPLTEPDASRSIGLVASGRDPLPSVTVGGVQALADDSVGAPRLRGVARTGKHSSGAFVWELYQTGLTDLWISTRPWKPPGPGQASLILYHAEILAAVANTLSVLDHFRGYVGAPDAEYGMEIEIGPFNSSGESLYYYGFFNESGIDQFDHLSLVLPCFSVNSRNEFEKLLSMIDIDVYDGLGIRRQRAADAPLKVII
jgi:hypothetical protein